MSKNKISISKELTKGIIKENQTLVMLLGMCPTLAITTHASNGIGMGLATTFVLLGSNIVISALRKIIKDTIRIPTFIVIIASFVTIIGLLLEGFIPKLYDSLGIYLPLITVNCIIFGRAEMFASKNNVVASACDAICMGMGFTLALFIMGSIREIIGAGQWFGMNIPVLNDNPMLLFIMPSGGFFTLGIIISFFNKMINKKITQEIQCIRSCKNCYIPQKENKTK